MREREALRSLPQGAIIILIDVDADSGVRVEFRSLGNGPLILIQIKNKMIDRDEVDYVPGSNQFFNVAWERLLTAAKAQSSPDHAEDKPLSGSDSIHSGTLPRRPSSGSPRSPAISSRDEEI